MKKAGQSSYAELVTNQNRAYKNALEETYKKEKLLLKNLMFPHNVKGDPLENVDNGISVNRGINYQKLPHIVNWNLNDGGRRTQWQAPT